MAWYLNRALTNFRAAVNAAFPNRDKASDGTIGDEAHQAGSSDHNPDTDGSVDAWDMDVNLRSGNDPDAIAELKRVFQAHPSSKYWIHNDQISFRSEGWRPRSYAYAGASRNRHTQHVHWNTRESHEDSTAPWILEDEMTPDQAKQLAATTARVEALTKLTEEITTGWSASPTGKEAVPGATALKAFAGLGPVLNSIVVQVGKVAAEVAALKADVAEIKTRPPAAITQDMLNEAVRAVMGSVDGATPQA